MQGDAIRMTLQVTDLLERMGITYAVGGSMSRMLNVDDLFERILRESN